MTVGFANQQCCVISVKERNTSESETDSEIEAMPTATAITEGWYKDGVSSAVKDFFQKQKEK